MLPHRHQSVITFAYDLQKYGVIKYLYFEVKEFQSSSSLCFNVTTFHLFFTLHFLDSCDVLVQIKHPQKYVVVGK